VCVTAVHLLTKSPPVWPSEPSLWGC